MKKTIVAIALVMVFIMAIAAPAFAQSMVHVADYKMNGEIWMNKQVGHYCNTGAEQKQTIRGTGEMVKSMDVTMVQGRLSVVDTNDYVASATAVGNLTVTSVIRLCTPPKIVYEDWELGDPVPFVFPLAALYPPTGFGINGNMLPNYLFLDVFEGMGWQNVVNGFNALAGTDYAGISDQIWAVQVSANPGFSGNLHQEYTAAFGGFSPFLMPEGEDWDVASLGGLNDFGDRWRWAYDTDNNNILTAERGPRYVGDYFNMKQMARTSQGEVKRYIDISSPWSHGYTFTDFEAQGFVEIGEQYTFVNLPEGVAARTKWWQDLF